jgi:hypothetical protein
MSKVTAYEYTVLDTNVVEWGTREAIEGLKDSAELIESSATAVDASMLNDGGFTPLDFDPRV